MRKYQFAFALLILMLLPGCIFQHELQEGMAIYQRLMNPVKGTAGRFDFSDVELEGANYYVFACKRSEHVNIPPIWAFFLPAPDIHFYTLYMAARLGPNLINGSCAIYKLGGDTKLSDFYILPSEGQSILDYLNQLINWQRPLARNAGLLVNADEFGEYAKRCDYNIYYVAKFIRGGRNGYLIPLNAKYLTMCFLSRSVIPMFIFDSGVGIPEEDNSDELVSQLRGVGPVFVFTDTTVKLDRDENGELTEESRQKLLKIKGQILRWKELCPNCLIGISVPLDDFEPFLQLLDNAVIREKVTAVGFALTMDDCDDEKFFAMGNNMSDLLRRAASYGKVSVMYAFNLPKKCMREERIIPGIGKASYQQLVLYSYYTNLPGPLVSYKALVKSGLLAMALPPLYSSPFPCEDCALLGGEARQPDYSMVIDFCRNFVKNRVIEPAVFSNATNPLLVLGSMVAPAIKSQPIVDFKGQKIRLLREYQPDDVVPEEFDCKGCLIISDDLPEFFDTVYRAVGKYSVDCEKAKEYGAIGGVYGIDPAFAAALAKIESDFNPCAISVVPNDYQQACGHSLTFQSQILRQLAEEAGCLEEFERKSRWRETADSYYFDPSELCSPGGSGESCVPCAFGLMQVTNPPGEVSAVTEMCGADYNPFKPADSMCAAAVKLRDFFEMAEQKLQLISDEGCEDVPDEDKPACKIVLYLFMTAYYYHGASAGYTLDNAIQDFKMLKQLDEEERDCEDGSPWYKEFCCSGEENALCDGRGTFLEFVATLPSGKKANFIYPLRVLSAYGSAMEDCHICFNREWLNNVQQRCREIFGNSEICDVG